MRRNFVLFFKKIIFRINTTFYNFLFKFNLWMIEANCGKGIKTYNGVPYIFAANKHCKLNFGNYVTINNKWNTGWYSKTTIKVINKGVLSIGDHSGFNSVLLYCANNITIGNYVNVGGGTRIYDTNFHDLDWNGRRDPTISKGTKTAPVKIEDDVFIGTGCIIGKGVTIGARSIIAAGSVVVKDIPSDCIAAGNPCKVVKELINKKS